MSTEMITCHFGTCLRDCFIRIIFMEPTSYQVMCLCSLSGESADVIVWTSLSWLCALFTRHIRKIRRSLSHLRMTS